MELRFLGHACFLLDDGACKVLTDPFLSGAGHPDWAEQVRPDYIFVTHGHGDHVGDAAAIARRTGAQVCCTADLADAVFGPAGVSCIAGNLGGHGPPALRLRQIHPGPPRRRGGRVPGLRLPL